MDFIKGKKERSDGSEGVSVRIGFKIEEDEKLTRVEEMLKWIKLVIYWLYMGVWMCAIGYTIYNICLSAAKFLDQPVRTKISVLGTNDGPMRLPTISICNTNKVNLSYLKSDPLLHLTWSEVNNYAAVDWTNVSLAQYANMTYQGFYQHSPSWAQTKRTCLHANVRYCRDIGHPLEDLIGQELSLTGKCFRFNPNGKILTMGGDYGSIYMRLNANVKENTERSNDGFIVAIHHHKQYSSTRNTGIHISPGFKYRLGMKTTQRRELPISQGGNCDPGLVENSYGSYDMESCYMECRDKSLNGSCGCVPVQAPLNAKYNNYRACTLREMSECGLNAYYKHIYQESDTSPSKEGGDTCHCPPPCNNTIYTLQTTTTALSREYAKMKEQSEGERFNFTAQDILDNFVKLEVFFTDLYEEVIEQIPAYGFWNLLADVGGMLGLFLGASVFTILNLFWLLIQKCVIYIRGGELAGEVQEEINPAECLPNIVETPR